MPGITETCFTHAHDARGPADHKIWFTNRISADSLGQGTRVPVQMLPPEFLKNLNETLDQLAYRRVDDAWRAVPGPIDPRADITPERIADDSADEYDAELKVAAAEISDRLSTIPAERARELAGRWPAAARRTLCLAVEPSIPRTGAGHRWILSYEDRALTVRQDEALPADAGTLVGPARTWLAILGGTANLAAELRAGRLRFLDASADANGPGYRSAASHLLAQLIGLAGPGQTLTSIKVPNPVEGKPR